MRKMLFLFVTLLFTSFSLGHECSELYSKLSDIPGALETIEGLKVLHSPAANDTSTQRQLRLRTTGEALKDLNE
ncbi:MAG: hypothetical protein ACKOA8_12385, partial [Deltaproteobacteria bacterium]